jgi:hypothetical protein
MNQFGRRCVHAMPDSSIASSMRRCAVTIDASVSSSAAIDDCFTMRDTPPAGAASSTWSCCSTIPSAPGGETR